MAQKSLQEQVSQFDQHHLRLIGIRWWDLKKSLQRAEVKMELENPFYSDHQIPQSSELLPYYSLDPASPWPAYALDVSPDHHVADFCSAPGGKALAILFQLRRKLDLDESTLPVSPEAKFAISLQCSDQSLARVKRLKAVLRSYLPENILTKIKIFHRDASRWGLYETDCFDRVLVDAPCSGERHLLQNQNELKKWSKSRSLHLRSRQMALLCSALEVLKPGGRLVYSTCSVSPLENDQLVERFLKKRKGRVKILSDYPTPSFGEKTEFGCQIWPDHPPFAGPIYYSVFTKN